LQPVAIGRKSPRRENAFETGPSTNFASETMGELIDFERARLDRAPGHTGLEDHGGFAQQPANDPRYLEIQPSAADREDPSATEGEFLRDEHGRFRSEIIHILDRIREVAIWAAIHLYDPDKPPVDPHRVQEQKWDQARRAFEGRYGRIAEARQLCMRLRKLTGKNVRVARMALAIALDEDKDLSKVLAGLAARAPLLLTDA
jgi:hypothetical protein